MIKTLASQLFSDDFPRSRVLTPAAAADRSATSLTAPFLFPGARSLNVAVTICVFVVLVGSFDLLLGYCGMVSFAHAMFYGIGAYGVAIALHKLGPTWPALAVGARRGAGDVGRAGGADRAGLAARQGDLLHDDHAGRGRRLRRAGDAAELADRRRRRPQLQRARIADAGFRAVRERDPRH